MLEVFQNFDLLSVGLVVAATTVLGFTVYFNNPKSITNKTFFVFALATVVWGTLNYVSYQFESPIITLWFLRLVLFFATWQAFTMFLLCYVFPENNKKFSNVLKFLIIPWTILISILTLTPFIFIDATRFLKSARVANPILNKFGIILFGITAISLVIYGLIILFKKTLSAPSDIKKRMQIVLVGLSLSLGLIVAFTFLFPVLLDNVNLIPLGALFSFPFAFLSSYAILKHKLFNIKVASTGVLVFLLSVVTFSEVVLAQDFSMVVYRSSVLLLVLSFGILLIKNILREVRQREEIQELAARLKSVNSILAHDVKATIAKGRDAFSLLLDGTYGLMPEKAKPLLAGVMKDMNKMLNAIVNILAAGHDMTLTLKPFDLKEAVLEAVRDAAKDAKEKHLTIKTDIPVNDYTITADKTQLVAHVLKNLIENAINYNLENGFITVSLARQDQKKFLLTIKDTGVGIKDEDKPNIFKEGGRGQESSKINVHSSGYGLVTAKKTVEAHGGRIWFESEGAPGKGATFFVELP